MDVVYMLAIGAVAGWLAGNFVKGGGFGLLGNMVIGIVGGLVGDFVFRQLGIGTDGSLLGVLLTSVIGAIVLLVIAGLLKKA